MGISIQKLREMSINLAAKEKAEGEMITNVAAVL